MRTYTKLLGSKKAIGTKLVVTVKTPSDNHGGCTPCFSVTADEYERGRIVACGAMHETIVEHFPELRDVVALHLSNGEGPMHAEANGWYWLAGACGGLGAAHHGSNDGRHSAEDCRSILASHLRVSFAVVADMVNTTQTIARQESVAAARENFKVWCADLAAQWAAEAAACELKYGGAK